MDAKGREMVNKRRARGGRTGEDRRGEEMAGDGRDPWRLDWLLRAGGIC